MLTAFDRIDSSRRSSGDARYEHFRRICTVVTAPGEREQFIRPRSQPQGRNRRLKFIGDPHPWFAMIKREHSPDYSWSIDDKKVKAFDELSSDELFQLADDYALWSSGSNFDAFGDMIYLLDSHVGFLERYHEADDFDFYDLGFWLDVLPEKVEAEERQRLQRAAVPVCAPSRDEIYGWSD